MTLAAQTPTQIRRSTVQHEVAGQEFLTFTLGKEEYGIDILKVQELRGYDNVTQIANAPDFLKGVVNLRGVITPIIDMRIKFNLAASSYDQFTVVVILHLGQRTVGMVVDGVSDVITLSSQQIKPAPEMGTVLNTDYLIGLGTLDDRMLILLDIDKLMSSDEIGLINKLTA
ncbi:cheW-like domain protein [Collimonas fungivorans]|jgi:purine-binding chemotaxis protein CheW|uniref:Chemotaxis protein CheW n=1 Tax=Collimonas fungivorans TaxID=158899 RepID=A0A127P8I2_9BURK|nr:chemotaxis protein CheW [Collimonas fungivorans]AMO93965.1 cheW-like domain protein [Collimonas fungivorans]